MARKEKEFDVLRLEEIVNVLAANAKEDGVKVTKGQVKDLVNSFLDEIVKGLNSGKSVAIPRFAKFELVRKAAHEARKPGTSEKVLVPEKVVVKVRPRKNLYDVRLHVK